MLSNITDKTLVLEWMGQRRELPPNWTLNLDQESEDYLVLKYKGQVAKDSETNSILEMVKPFFIERPKETTEEIKKTKGRKKKNG